MNVVVTWETLNKNTVVDPGVLVAKLIFNMRNPSLALKTMQFYRNEKE